MHDTPNHKSSSIQRKVFFSFAGILLCSILITLLFGNSMMERLYIDSKSDDLSKAYHDVAAMLDKQQNPFSLEDDLLECFFEIEQNNINILVFTLNDTRAEVQYFSRPNWIADTLDAIPSNMQIHTERPVTQSRPGLHSLFMFSPHQWIEHAAALGVFDTARLPIIVTDSDESTPNQTLDYYGTYTKDNTTLYIFLRTPKEAVSLAAQLAVKYNLYIALATFILMAITSYFVSKRITRPITEISEATNRIGKTDFSQPLDIHTGDELEALSQNINNMSEKLQDYIYQLQLNQQLLEKDLEREARTGQMRKEFIANVSHDFKTPLTLIRAYTETIRNQTLGDTEHQQYCDIILNESERLNHMVTQLLHLSRLESGTVKLELSYFPMEELLRDVLYRNQLLYQQKGLHIHWLYDEEDHIVEGDYTRIEQVVINLIENAIKYAPERGNIMVDIHADGTLCHIAITNTSEPLSEVQLENLFISFYKADESRHLEQQSFGLGLAIVKATMDLHHQPCTASNTPDGLQIAFSLPLITMEDEEYDGTE